MLKRLSSLLLVAVPCFYVFANDASIIDWSEEDYQILHGDFDGDGKLDSVIVAKSSDMASYLFSDVGTENTITEHWVSFNPDTYTLVSGDFDNDLQDEILVFDSELSGFYWDFDAENGFVEGEQKLKVTGYSKSRQINFTHLYKGDFNGDGSADLIAYAADSHDIVTLLNKDKENKIKFKFDAQLFLSNDSPMALKVNDFNNDGLEDIILLSSVQDGASYVAFAGKKGKFKKSEFEEISPYLGNSDWSTQQHSFLLWTNVQKDERQIVRLANAKGGFDEEGNPLSDEDALGANSSAATFSQETSCEHLAYSAISKTVTTTCAVYSDEEAMSAADDGGFISALASKLQTMLSPELDMNTVSSSVSQPGWVNANVYNGDDIQISWDAVSGADTYNREVSLNGGGWQNTKTYPGSQTSVWFYNQQVRSYRYRVRACIGATCSFWTESSSVTVNPTPTPPFIPAGTIPNVSGGNYIPVNTGFTVNLPYVAGATYYQLYSGTSEHSVYYRNGGSRSLYHPGQSSYGFLYIKYKACNSGGCSQLSQYQRAYIYTAPGPANNTAVNPSSLNYGGNAFVSWTKAGGMIPSGYYMVHETKPGQSEVHISSITAGTASSYAIAATPNGSPGSYTYRIIGCNPSVGCGGSRSVSTTLVNRAPVADNESASVQESSSVSINVLSGDYDPDEHSFSISSYTQPAKGEVTCSGVTCTFTSNSTISSNYSDVFNYTITDTYGASGTGTVYVTINNVISGTVATPVISPSGRVYTGALSVSITSATSGAAIYYTTNGTTPSVSSTPYTGAFSISSDIAIKALAVKADYYNSAVASEDFDWINGQRRVVFVHTDLLGSPAAETDENGNVL